MKSNLSYRSAKDIKKHQDNSLRELVHYLKDASPYYQKVFEAQGIDVSHIRHTEDLTQLPVTTKKDLQQYNTSFWCVTENRIADFCTTSGTTGHPVIIPLTPHDIKRLAGNEAQALGTAGCNQHDRIQLTTTIDKMFMAGMAYFQGARALGATTIKTGPGSPQLQWDMIFSLKTTVLIIVPSFLLKLIEYAKAENIPFQESTVKKVICIGEPVRKPDFTLNALGQKISNQWNVEMYGTYASSEMQTAFTECHEHKGGHLIPELIITELLDDNNRPVKPGEPGNVTITTLGIEGMPLLRFQTGDIAYFHDDPCACGRNSLRIGPLIGRKDQMIKMKGTTVFPSTIVELLNSIEGITDYVVELTSDAFKNDVINVHLHITQNTNHHYIEERLRAALRVMPHMVYTDQDTIHNMKTAKSIRKIQHIVDHRQ